MQNPVLKPIQTSLLLLLATGFSLQAIAAPPPPNFPTEAYDATYVRKNEQGVSDYRYCTDGIGHVRIETSPPSAGYTLGADKQSKTVTIFDYPRKVTYTLLEKQKIALKQPLNANASGAQLSAQRIKELGGEDLGADTKFNHPCHGYKWDENGVTTESWIATDLNCPIHTEKIGKNGSETMHLAQFKRIDPDQHPEEYEVPADYKISESGGFGAVR